MLYIVFIIRDVFRNKYSQGMPRPISSYHDNPLKIRLIAKKHTDLPGRHVPYRNKKNGYTDEICIIGNTGSYPNDNFQCSQWRRFRQNADNSVLVLADAGLPVMKY